MINKDPVVAIEWHHIGNGTQGDQVEKLGHIRYRQLLPLKPTTLLQFPADGGHHIKNHPHPAGILAAKFATVLIGVDQRIGIGQRITGQMVIGHHYPHPRCLSGPNALHTGDAIIHRNQQLGRLFSGYRNDLRTQPIAVFKPIRHQITGPGRTQSAQCRHRKRATGSPVTIKIADH